MPRPVIIDPDGDRIEAFFLRFGLSFEELRDGVGTINIAICQLPNGKVMEVYLSHIQFVVPALPQQQGTLPPQRVPTDEEIEAIAIAAGMYEVDASLELSKLGKYWQCWDYQLLAFAHALLARHGRPAAPPAPVPTCAPSDAAEVSP